MDLATGKTSHRDVLPGVEWQVLLLQKSLDQPASGGASINERLRHAISVSQRPANALI
jgi:hypothetical protein